MAKKREISVNSYTRKDGTRVRASRRSISTQNLAAIDELNRSRTKRELAQDIGAALTALPIPIKNRTSGVWQPATLVPITKKGSKHIAASQALRSYGRVMNVNPRNLAQVRKEVTKDYTVNPNSKKAIKEINTLKNRAKIAGLSEKRFKKEKDRYERLMRNAGFEGMKVSGTDFSRKVFMGLFD
jgi:hypothetical protein